LEDVFDLVASGVEVRGRRRHDRIGRLPRDGAARLTVAFRFAAIALTLAVSPIAAPGATPGTLARSDSPSVLPFPPSSSSASCSVASSSPTSPRPRRRGSAPSPHFFPDGRPGRAGRRRHPCPGRPLRWGVPRPRSRGRRYPDGPSRPWLRRGTPRRWGR
jgi:hypothetical protein